MARPLRIEYDGAWYHVMNRGLERRVIFLNDADRRRFLDLLGETHATFGIEFHAYSLMGNHYHLLAHTPQSGLGRAMRHLNGVYTQKFNKTHERDGPLFSGRYKAFLIDSEEYAAAVARYIHLNPVAAGLCRSPEAHEWTSHRHYLCPENAPAWLKTGEILGRFGSGAKTVSAFADYVSNTDIETAVSAVEGRKGDILGGEGFRQWAHDTFVSAATMRDRQIPGQSKSPQDKAGPGAILKRVAFACGVPVGTLRQGGRRRRNDARIMAAFVMRHALGLPLADIASHLNMSDANSTAQALYRARDRFVRDPEFASRATGIRVQRLPGGRRCNVK